MARIPPRSAPVLDQGTQQFALPWWGYLNGCGPAGPYNATFASGQVQYSGPNGFAGNNNMIFGTNLPTPGGRGAALLLGSGGGSGTPASFWIITDEAFDTATPGDLLGISAGEVAVGSSQPGGTLWLIGGAADFGTGGTLLLQGGTSARGPGGLTVVQGGNASNGTSAAGDVHIIAGEAGGSGANVHVTSTTLGGSSGFIRFSNGSDITHTSIMMDLIPYGAASGGNQPFQMFLYGNGGLGTAGAPLVSQAGTGGVKWFSGFTGSITFGTGHTMTVTNGLITGYS